MQYLRSYWLGGLLLALLSSCAEPMKLQGFRGQTMGSTYEVKLVTKLPLSELVVLVNQELAAFDVAFSNWRESSEIVRVNAHVSTEPMAVSDRFADVLEQALVIAAATDGAYDPTLKPLSDLYRRAKQNPDLGLMDEELQKANERVGYRMISVEGGKLVKQRPDLEIDLDGIVAGAAADAIAAKFTELGIASFYLEITGEVLCRGVKPNGEPWRIGVVDPASDSSSGQTPIVTLPLRDAALCSSGDYRNAVIVGGRVVHHIFDPRTGRNPEHALVSVSVIAESCAIADALGTALMVMGDEAAKERWSGLDVIGAKSALFIKPGVETQWQEVRIQWPLEDS